MAPANSLKEQKFLEELGRQWGHEMVCDCVQAPHPRSADSGFRCKLQMGTIPSAILGSVGSGKNPDAARTAAVRNFMHRLKTSYVPDIIYTNLCELGISSQYTSDVLAVLKILEEHLKQPEWSRLYTERLNEHPDSKKAIARNALLKIRPQIHEYWTSRGFVIGPPNADTLNTPSRKEAKAEKRVAELMNNTPTSSNGIEIVLGDDSPPPAKRSRLDEGDDLQNNEVDVIELSSSSSTTSESSDDSCIKLDISTNSIDLHVDSNQEVEAVPETPSTSTSVSLPKEGDEVVVRRIAPAAPLNGHVDLKAVLGVTCHYKPQWYQSICSYRDKYQEAFESLDEKIMLHYRVNRQTDKIYERKTKARELLCDEIQQLFPNFGVRLYAVGSTVNSCGSYNSDMDLCLVLERTTRDRDGTVRSHFEQSKNFAVQHLRQVFRLLRYRSHLRHYIHSLSFISQAKVPIIKLQMGGEYADLEVDINVNNVAGIYNSHLLHYYARVDERFPALCLLVKHWAINNDINDAMTGTLNSYSIILLVAHYLQCGVSPPVLPNLQHIYPHKFSRYTPLAELDLFLEFDPPLPYSPPNTWSPGELLVGFFYYYANFPFEREAISVAQGRRYSRDILPAETQKFRIYIEEPFDTCNTARCVTKQEQFRKIKSAFMAAAKAFATQAPDLAKILVDVPELEPMLPPE